MEIAVPRRPFVLHSILVASCSLFALAVGAAPLQAQRPGSADARLKAL